MIVKHIVYLYNSRKLRCWTQKICLVCFRCFFLFQGAPTITRSFWPGKCIDLGEDSFPPIFADLYFHHQNVGNRGFSEQYTGFGTPEETTVSNPWVSTFTRFRPLGFVQSSMSYSWWRCPSMSWEAFGSSVGWWVVVSWVAWVVASCGCCGSSPHVHEKTATKGWSGIFLGIFITIM